MLEKNYLNIIQEIKTQDNIHRNEYKKIKKGDKVSVVLQNGKNRKQTIEGLCTTIRKNKCNPSITIKYKLSGVIIEQRIPFGIKEFTSIQMLR